MKKVANRGPDNLSSYNALLQAISKVQITFKDKARADEKAQHTRGM